MKQKKLKRRSFLLAVFFLTVLFLLAPATLAKGETVKEQQSETQFFMEESGADSLFPKLPEEGKRFLLENGVRASDQSSLMNLSFSSFLASLWKSATSAVGKPVRMLASAVGVILLCALLKSMQDSFENHSMGRVFSTVSILCISAVIIVPIGQLILDSAKMIRQASNYFLSFIPVYVGVIASSGKPLSAASCNTYLMIAAQVVSRLAATVLIPLMTIYLALCLMGSASQEINISGITKVVKNIVLGALGLFLTIFVGFLSVQGSIAASADSVAIRTAKFAAGTFLPVVGGALSDAFNTLEGCAGVVRSTVGGFGILAAVALFLPEMITILLFQLALLASGFVSDTIGLSPVSDLVHSANSVLTLLFGVLAVFLVLFLVSLAMVFALSGG